MPSIVEANGLVKQYPGSPEPAVRGVSFTIQPGEIFGLLGPNGAGKTTMISMLSCLLTPTAGSATVTGFDVIRQPAEVKRRIGLAPQDLANLSCRHARHDGRRAQGDRRRWRNFRARAAYYELCSSAAGCCAISTLPFLSYDLRGSQNETNTQSRSQHFRRTGARGGACAGPGRARPGG